MTSHLNTYVATKAARNSAEFPVLGLLIDGPLHGYEICRQLNQEIGSIWRLGKSQIYAMLAKLEREGLLARERVGQENLPAKNIFTVTPEGYKVFKEWTSTPVYHVRDMRLEFITKLWFAQRLGSGQEASLIEAQLSVCREKLRKLETGMKSVSSGIEARSSEFRMVTVRSAISWLCSLSEPKGVAPGQQQP